jgi:hypothetical protein
MIRKSKAFFSSKKEPKTKAVKPVFVATPQYNSPTKTVFQTACFISSDFVSCKKISKTKENKLEKRAKAKANENRLNYSLDNQLVCLNPVERTKKIRQIKAQKALKKYKTKQFIKSLTNA